MNISIIGAGNLGTALGGQLMKAGHSVTYGVKPETVNPAENKVSVADAAAKGDVIIIATPVDIAPTLAQELGDVSGKIVIDATNTVVKKPEGFENGFEAFTALLPGAKLVKGFNSTGFENISNLDFNGVRADAFMAGDSPEAKEAFTKLAKDIGFGEVYDFGGSDKAPLLESFALSWINLAIFQKIGRTIAFKVLKK